MKRLALLLAAALSACQVPPPVVGAYDLVILNGRVMDPETGLDAVRNVGILKGTVAAVTSEPIAGKASIDARGLVVAPGFIDLHSHGQDPENYALKAQDGVTAALELEVGTSDVDRWYMDREGRALVHFGVSVGHIPVRMDVLGDPPAFLPPGSSKAATQPASDAELQEILQRLARGLERGAAAVGFGLQYTPAASRWEVLEAFRVAARFSASCHVHMRYGAPTEPESSVEALEELLAATVVTGAPLHVVHVHSTGKSATPRLLDMIAEARARGVDVTTECYPYTAGMTEISSNIFGKDWKRVLGIDYGQLQWAATGEWLTAESFAKYRKTGGLVIAHAIPEEAVNAAVAHPLVMMASDGLVAKGKGHPRSAGAYARLLGRYARDAKALSLMDALRKITFYPARRLEARVPAMRQKGRLQVGADADLTIFDPARIADRATYEEPAKPSEGIAHVLVEGVFVVKDGKLQAGVLPGRPIRAPIR